MPGFDGPKRPLPSWAQADVPDNGKNHYGTKLKGSICGVEVVGRKETWIAHHVTCPECLKILRRRGDLPVHFKAGGRWLP